MFSVGNAEGESEEQQQQSSSHQGGETRGDGASTLRSGKLSGLIASSKSLEDMFTRLSHDMQRLIRIPLEQRRMMRHYYHDDDPSMAERFRMEVSDVCDKVNSLRAQYEEGRLQIQKWRFYRGSNLTEKMKKMHIKVQNLIEQGLILNIRLSALLAMGLHMSSRTAIKQILGCFTGRQIKIIGLCGSQISVDTLIGYLLDSVYVYRLFDFVIDVAGLDFSDHHTILQVVANKLNIEIEIDDDDDATAAAKIHEALENSKYLLILDDGVEEYYKDLGRLGIPNNNDNGSKMIVTSSRARDCKRNKADHVIYVPDIYEASSPMDE